MSVQNNNTEIFSFYGEEEEERNTEESPCALCNISIPKKVI